MTNQEATDLPRKLTCEERDAESEDHAATVTGGDERDRAMEIAQALAQAHAFTTVSALSIANAALTLAAPVEVDEAKLAELALRFCTCSHWLEEHHERECLADHCACKDFDPVLRGEGR